MQHKGILGLRKQKEFNFMKRGSYGRVEIYLIYDRKNQ